MTVSSKIAWPRELCAFMLCWWVVRLALPREKHLRAAVAVLASTIVRPGWWWWW